MKKKGCQPLRTEIILSDNLQRLLEEKNLRLSALARKVSMNKSTLHNWTYGAKPSSLTSLVKLAQFFDISLDDLCLGGDVKLDVRSDEELRLQVTLKFDN